MENVLIVSSTPKAAEYIDLLLRPMRPERVFCAASGNEARRIVCENDIDYVFINTPLTDEFGHELAMSVSVESGANVILFVKSEISDEITDKVVHSGVFVVPKPVSEPFFFQAVNIAIASRRKLSGLRQENTKLQVKIKEIRLIDRAKCTLIQYLNMTEKQAHRYIEKQAMDMRTSKADIAQGILKTYET